MVRYSQRKLKYWFFIRRNMMTQFTGVCGSGIKRYWFFFSSLCGCS